MPIVLAKYFWEMGFKKTKFCVRYDGFDKEMNANASRVAVVNQLARQLIHVEHPAAPKIQERQAALNSAWGALREKVCYTCQIDLCSYNNICSHINQIF